MHVPKRRPGSLILGTIRDLKGMGVALPEPTAVERKLAAKFGPTPSEEDIVWALFNTAATKAPRETMVHFSMARFLYEEGRDWTEKMARCWKIQEADNSSSFDKYMVHAGTACCVACAKHDGRVVPYASGPPTPLWSGCTNLRNKSGRGWCTCYTSPVIHESASP